MFYQFSRKASLSPFHRSGAWRTPSKSVLLSDWTQSPVAGGLLSGDSAIWNNMSLITQCYFQATLCRTGDRRRKNHYIHHSLRRVSICHLQVNNTLQTCNTFSAASPSMYCPLCNLLGAEKTSSVTSTTTAKAYSCFSCMQWINI